MHIEKVAVETQTVYHYNLQVNVNQLHVLLMALERYESDIRWDYNPNIDVANDMILAISEVMRGQ